MVEEQLARRGVTDEHVLTAMRRVPRHLFVEEALQNRAHGDHPLPIGEEQTISQPYIVGLMTQLLELHGQEKVLEVGTGSGYQTSVLAELARRVCSSGSATTTCGCASAAERSAGPTRRRSIGSS